MHDASLVTMQKSTKDLPNCGFGLGECHWFVSFLEPLPHVEVEILENKVKFVITMDNVYQIYYILVLKFAQEGDFADSC